MREVERLVGEGKLSDVVVQYGFSTVQPKDCMCKQFLSYDEMKDCYARADAVVTHGGPSTFIEAMSYGKVPVVVPRQAQFNEHVNDHQVKFVKAFAERMGGIIPVYDIKDLEAAIAKATGERETNTTVSNNAKFCSELSTLVERL